MMNSNVGGNSGETGKGFGLHGFLACLLIVIVSVALYYETTKYEFVYDDIHIISNNQNITALKDDASGFIKLYTQEFWAGVNEGSQDMKALLQPKGQALYRPVMLTMFGLIYTFIGPEPNAFHLMNIIVNALICVAVFLTVKRMFGSMRIGFFSGLLFACHPIHTEAVCYVTGMGELLGMLFFLLAILNYVKASYDDRGFRLLPYILSLVFFMIGLFSKENVITLIGILIVYDFIQAIGGRRPFGIAKRIGMYAGYFCIIGLNILARYNAIGSLQPGNQNPIDNVVAAAQSYPIQLFTAIKVLGKAIWLTILPLELSPDYSYAAIVLSNGPFEADVLSAFVFVFCLLVIAFAFIKKLPVVSFGIFWFFITIFLVSNIVLIVGTIFGERLLYTPSLGICLVVAFVLDRIFSIGEGRQRAIYAGSIIGSILLIAVSAAGAVKTMGECKKWTDSEYLFQAAAKVCPESSRVHYQLGQIYTINKCYQEAEKELLTVLRIDKSFLLAYFSLGDLYVMQGQNEKAVRIFEELKKNLPDSPNEERLTGMLSQRLAHTYSALKKPEQAIGEMMIMKGEDNNPLINMNIGSLYLQSADYENAAKFFQEAWDLAPDKLEPARMLLNCYKLAGNTDKMNELLDRLEELDTKTNFVHATRAEIHFNAFELEKALEEIDKAIAKVEKDPNAYMMKAMILQAQFRLEDALVTLDKAIEFLPPQQKAAGLIQKLEIYKQLNNMEMAEKTAERLKELPLTPDVKGSLGDLYVRMERYTEATQYLRESIAGGMKVPLNFVNLGKALVELNKFEDIVALLGPAVDELQIADPELYRILGSAYIEVKKYERGVELLQESLRTWGPHPWIKFQIAQAQFELKNYKKVANILDAMEAKFKVPQLVPMIYHLRAKVLLEYEEMLDPKQAAVMAQKAIESMTPELFPDSPKGSPAYHLTWVKALKAAGNTKQADKVLEAALQKFPADKALKAYQETGK